MKQQPVLNEPEGALKILGVEYSLLFLFYSELQMLK